MYDLPDRGVAFLFLPLNFLGHPHPLQVIAPRDHALLRFLLLREPLLWERGRRAGNGDRRDGVCACLGPAQAATGDRCLCRSPSRPLPYPASGPGLAHRGPGAVRDGNEDLLEVQERVLHRELSHLHASHQCGERSRERSSRLLCRLREACPERHPDRFLSLRDHGLELFDAPLCGMSYPLVRLHLLSQLDL